MQEAREDGTEDFDDWESYRFDASFFQEGRGRDEGGMAVFRLIGPSTKYLHIFNSHNGYYGHGFNFSVDGTIVQEGGL